LEVSLAKTPAEIEEMKAKVDEAEKVMKSAYKRLLIKYHPDKNLGANTKPETDLLAESLQRGEKEIALARKKLDTLIEAQDTQTKKFDTQSKSSSSAWSPNDLFRAGRRRFRSKR
jgi:DnaJ-class molecular chaperone